MWGCSTWPTNWIDTCGNRSAGRRKVYHAPVGRRGCARSAVLSHKDGITGLGRDAAPSTNFLRPLGSTTATWGWAGTSPSRWKMTTPSRRDGHQQRADGGDDGPTLAGAGNGGRVVLTAWNFRTHVEEGSRLGDNLDQCHHHWPGLTPTGRLCHAAPARTTCLTDHDSQ